MKQITTYSTLLIFLTIAAGAHAGKSNIDYSSKSQIQSTQKPVTQKLASPKLTAPKAVTTAPPRNTQKGIIPGATNPYGARSLDDGETWKMQNQPSSTKTRTLQNRSTNQYRNNTANPQPMITAPRKWPTGYTPNSAISNNKALQNRNMNQYRNNAINQPSAHRNAMQRPPANTRGSSIPGTSNGLTKQYGRPQNAPGAPTYGFGSKQNTYTPGGPNSNNSRTTGFGIRDLHGTRPGAPDMNNPMSSSSNNSPSGIEIVEHGDEGGHEVVEAGSMPGKTGGIEIVEHGDKSGPEVVEMGVMPGESIGIEIMEHGEKGGHEIVEMGSMPGRSGGIEIVEHGEEGGHEVVELGPSGNGSSSGSTSPGTGSSNSGDSNDGNDSGDEGDSGDSSGDEQADTSDADDDDDGDNDTSSDDSSDDSGSDDTTADSEEADGDEGAEGGDDERSEGTGGGANDSVDAYLQSLAEKQRTAGRDEDNSDDPGCGKTGQMGPGGGDCTSRSGKTGPSVEASSGTIDGSMIDVRPSGTIFGRGGTSPGDCFKPEGCDEAMDRTPSEFLGDSPFVNPVGD